MQLFCFTFAGGTADFFSPLESVLSPGIEVHKLEYPGHGTRHREPFSKSIEELAADLYPGIVEKYTGNGYALMGYSMGSIVAVELLKLILADGKLPEPCHVFLAAHEPHSKAELIGFGKEESDQLVKERTIRFGGVPDSLVENNIFWRVYLPVYRADYSMIGKYNFDQLTLKTEIPACIFYSPTDTPLSDIHDWGNFFIGQCDFLAYEGNHFFINKHYRAIAEQIKERLERKNDDI